MQIFAFSNLSLGYFREEKPVKWARGWNVHVLLVILFTLLDIEQCPLAFLQFRWRKVFFEKLQQLN